VLSILIVDDEKLARADILYKVSRSGICFKWVMEASSAEEAIEMVKEHKPDILITDIMMGEMSGIDLVRLVRTSSLEIVTILVSGHSEFSFAKEAIALNVVDYLLKPIRQKELTATLSSAVTKVMNQKDLLQLTMHNEKAVDALLSERQKEQLHAFLSGMETNVDFSAATLFPEKARCFQIGLFRLSFLKQAADMEVGDKLDFERLRMLVQEIIREIGGPWFFTFDNFARKRQIIVIAASPKSELKTAGDSLAKTFDKIYSQIRYRLKVVLHVGVSGIAESLSGVMMTQARQALDLHLSYESEPCGRIFYWDEWKNLSAANLPEEDFKIYKSLLAVGDLNNALIIVRRIFSSDVPSMALHIRMLYVEMICILAHTCIKKVGGSVVSMLGPECLGGGIVDQFSDREELIDSLCRTISTALSQWMPVAADVGWVLQNVKNYIEANFTNSELSTNFLSKKFCVSLGYLSTSYKKTFGITITKHIISLQMDYAKKLLEETKLPILAIAENSGYLNLSYFMRTFKKHVECTPTEYREKSLCQLMNLDTE
jgi:two-component system response regulator YesN